MTDLPRRSYPLVVPPPGGFESAVHQGRKLRRRRTSGGSAIALVAVGALAYSMLGHGGGTSSLNPIDQPAVNHHTVVSGASAAPSAPPATSASQAGGSNTVAGPRAGNPAASTSPGAFDVPPVVGPGAPSRPYAHRQPISPPADDGPNTDTTCVISSTSTATWCATTTVTVPTPSNSSYVLKYTLCRNVNAGNATLTFKGKQEVDFVAKDLAHDDTVWTYSAGQPVVAANDSVFFGAGYCKSWHVEWDGYDDFGRFPPAGSYQLVANSLSVQPVPSDAYNFTHD